MTELDSQLSETWGPAATHSEYRRGDTVRYLVGLQTFTGTILWIAGPGPSHVEDHAPLATRYIVERQGWENSFPDVVYSSDITGLEGPQEPVLIQCPIHLSAWYYEGGTCPFCYTS